MSLVGAARQRKLQLLLLTAAVFQTPSRGQVQDVLSGCEDSCSFAFDNECDDGGAGSALAACRLGTDCNDCGWRNVSVLPIRELGYRSAPNQQPAQGLAGASGDGGPAEFVADATFEQCAAMCREDCIAFVRRHQGTNCWLIPTAWYPGGDIELVTWTGGTTYVKLPDCNATTTSCDLLWGMQCECEPYAVKNTVVHNGFEYASLDDIPAVQPTQSGFGGQRCPNDAPDCPGSTCSRTTAGQNYFLKMPCGWDFFPITGYSISDNYPIWNEIVSLGWGTHCINDPFTGAAFWTFGSNGGYDDGDIERDQDSDEIVAVHEECGQMHTFSPSGDSRQIGWYMEASAAEGFRSTSCGRRFLIRRPLGCLYNVPNITAASDSAGAEGDVPLLEPQADRLSLTSTGGAFLPRQINRALVATVWDNIQQHSEGDNASNINDGRYGNDRKWSSYSETTNAVDPYIYVALGLDERILIDTIAFGRDNSGANVDNFIGTYTFQVSVDPFTGVDGEYAWTTVGSLIYSGTSPLDGSRRHQYRVSPPVPANAIRVIVNSRYIAIDELEIYGVRATETWMPINNARVSNANATVTDSAGNAQSLISGDGGEYNTGTGASVSIELDGLYTLYIVSFRTTDPVLWIRRCKIAYLNMDSQLLYARLDGSHTADPSLADYILDLDSLPGGMNSDYGMEVTLPVPIETSQLRFFDIEGQENSPTVNVQFGISGHAALQPISGVPGDPRLDVQVEATGFDDTVGCDTVQYAITVRHAMNVPGRNSNLARQLRVSDMLSDSKIDLVYGTVTVEKSIISSGTSATWQPMSPSLHRVVEGNGDSDALVIVDVDHLYVDEILRITYTAAARDPAPKDIVSARAVVELLDRDNPCIFDQDSLRVCDTTGRTVPAPCGVTRRAIAWHEIASDVGALAFSHSASNSGSKPNEVTIDGTTREVYLISVDVDVSLIAGTATNVLLRVAVPSDRTQYFELLSIDNVDNNARTGTSEDDTVLQMDMASMMTQRMEVPCNTRDNIVSSSSGMHLELTGALYNSFYYSGEYICGDNGCNELQLDATLEYDLVSATIFHERYTSARLLNLTRMDGFELPSVFQTTYGVRYTGGNPTWPLATINLENGDLPDDGYE
eukprot:SAG31_NODE_3239_length_4507_cov_2.410617_1_plen_1122_part_10